MVRNWLAATSFCTHCADGKMMSYRLPAASLACMPSIESKFDWMTLTPYSFWKPSNTVGST